jgi:hypothetical protein
MARSGLPSTIRLGGPMTTTTATPTATTAWQQAANRLPTAQALLAAPAGRARSEA